MRGGEEVMETIEVGTFEVMSGWIAVGDPCYSREADRPDLVFQKPCVSGTWTAQVLIGDAESPWGQRVNFLIATCGEGKFSTRRSGVLLVDSGQMSIFDSVARPDDPGDYMGPSFYHECCEAHGEEYASIALGAGVVSSSGYGDGVYNVYLARNEKGLVVGVKVRFI